ncbi:MAG: N-acetylmuramic acid 6-phosphate etherase [Acidobacteria bacterium]|nr:N-acetylmuramic acid 6-phosphate etherase [Acidobacteriota bacterium]MDA1233185.1 N-acetylmuramic acid 6-phosphate etherase [Acidobacteriota bacterium]
MIEKLPSEQRNPASERIDAVSTKEMLEIINREDAGVAAAVEAEIPRIADAVDAIAERFAAGGRLFYVGAGTSGRLAVLDAAELPPTYGLEPGRVIALIAGGAEAVVRSVEGAEDDESGAIEDLSPFDLTSADCVIGIAASGRTPYVVGALRFAQGQGAWTGAVTTNPKALLRQFSDVVIAPAVGPEVITGSTRMKSGTAQKLVLNMISTALMVRMGCVLGNRMVNVQLTNEKLWDRAERIVAEIAGVDRSAAAQSLKKAGDVRIAVLMLTAHLELEEAKTLLNANRGILRAALAAAEKGT